MSAEPLSARSFTRSLRHAEGGGRLEPPQTAERTFIRAASKKACDYNKFRAKLAHRVPVEKRNLRRSRRVGAPGHQRRR